MSSAHFVSLFDADRMRIYPRVGLVLNILCLAAIAAVSEHLFSPWNAPIGGDFLIFYSAAKLALQGDVASIADAAKMLEVHRSIVPAMPWTQPWPYPPPFLVLITPLALLPYIPAYVLFCAGTLAAFVAALSRIRGTRPFLLAVLASPAVLLCISCGHTSFLTAAMFAGGLALIEKRPFLAGLVFGGLAYKPQFGVYLPLAFLAAGQLRAVCGAGVGALGFSALATAIFGLAPWRAFLDTLPRMIDYVAKGDLAMTKIISAFNFARLLGASVTAATILQGLVSISAAFAIALVWRRRGPGPLAGAVLISGTMLSLPYLFDYEFAVLLIPLVLLAADMTARGASREEKVLLLALYLSPLAANTVALATHVQLGFPVMAATLCLCVRRALLASGGAVTPSPNPA